MSTLDEIENRLQTLLETNLVKYMPGFKAEDRLYQRLALAMHDNLKRENAIIYAPDKYMILAHSSIVARWQIEPRLSSQLAGALHSVGVETGSHFNGNVMVTIIPDEDLPVSEIRILTAFSEHSLGETRAVANESQTETGNDTYPVNAFLILGGSSIIPINQSVVNIGRRLDNQIVIEDPRVSRVHAQVRAARNGFVIFDLDSKGGTFVNSRRINQAILEPGDVISLAGVKLIFNQDLLSNRDLEEESTESSLPFSSDLQSFEEGEGEKQNRKKVG